MTLKNNTTAETDDTQPAAPAAQAPPPVQASATRAPAPGSAPNPAPVTSGTPTAPATLNAAAPQQTTTPADDPEQQRILAIRRHCASAGTRYGDIVAQAIREGWDVTRTELEVLRASRPKPPPMVMHRTGPEVSGVILEAACALSAKLDGLEKQYDERTLDAASSRFRGGIGLQELLLEAAWANGYTGRNFRDSRTVLHFAFAGSPGSGGRGLPGGPGVEAAFSSVDLGGILSNVSNKFLLQGFYSVERTWRNVCALRNVTDFKEVTSYRLIGADQYELVPPGGKLKHGTLGNESFSNRANTYGLMLGIDRRDIINDDLGAITLAPRKLGRGSGLKINDVFWTEFHAAVAGLPFFSTANKNLLTGTDTVLSIDGLTKAEVAFLDQVDPEGKPIGVMPVIVLVPTTLSAIGSQLYKSMELRDTTANSKFPVSNPHQGRFRVEVSTYLSNLKYAGAGGVKAWYLLADPLDLPVIEVAFLNGNESPTIETVDADFSVLGIQMRGYHDFGVKLQDPRAAIKSKGEA